MEAAQSGSERLHLRKHLLESLPLVVHGEEDGSKKPPGACNNSTLKLCEIVSKHVADRAYLTS